MVDDNREQLNGIDISRQDKDSQSLSESDASLLKTLIRSRGDHAGACIDDLSIEEITIQTGRFVAPKSRVEK